MKAIHSFFIVIPLVIYSCQHQAEALENPPAGVSENKVMLSDSQMKFSGIQLGAFEQRKLSSTIRVTGVVDVPPQNLVSVSVHLGGYLKSTKLLPGMHVNKGEVIATLEDQQYIQLQQDYLMAKARLEQTEAEYNRQKELNESKASSDKDFQQAKADYLALKITCAALKEKLQLINISPEALDDQQISKTIRLYAPFDGFVSKVNVNVGKYVSPSEVIFELVNPDDIHLNLIVFEKDLVQLDIGQKLWAYTNSHPELKYPCEIILISKDISPERTAEVHCHFEKYDKSLLPGMYMTADIQLNSISCFAVPDEAIVSYEGKNHLFVSLGNSTFQMVEITTGKQEAGWIEIVDPEGIKQKTLVLKGAYSLLMSLKNKEEE